MKSMTKNNVYLVFSVKGAEEPLGRVELQLFDDECPRTAKNFRTICSGEKGKGKGGVKMWYQGSPIHRCVQGAFIQGGDFIKGTGAYGESIYGGDFKDEPKGLKRAFDVPGLLAMANSGKNSNTSQFFITVAAQPQLNGHHVIFGRVVTGMEVVEKVLQLHAGGAGQGEGWKEAPVIVSECGVL